MNVVPKETEDRAKEKSVYHLSFATLIGSLDSSYRLRDDCVSILLLSLTFFFFSILWKEAFRE